MKEKNKAILKKAKQALGELQPILEKGKERTDIISAYHQVGNAVDGNQKLKKYQSKIEKDEEGHYFKIPEPVVEELGMEKNERWQFVQINMDKKIFVLEKIEKKEKENESKRTN